MNVNFRSFTAADALDFVAYCALTCNGLTLIAEICRRVTLDPFLYQGRFLECNESMYTFLCKVNKEIMPNVAVGSCTDNRFTFSQGSSKSDWAKDREKLFDVCNQFYVVAETTSRQKLLMESTTNVLKRLINSKVHGKSEFHGVGPMSANQFVQMASLIGLIPLYCFTMANIHSVKLGPSKAIRVGLNNPNMKLNEIQETFSNIVNELKSVWGNLVTTSLIENMLCEISRSYNATTKAMKANGDNRKLALSVICDETHRNFRESQAKDLFFYDDALDCMQNVFNVTSGSSGGTCLRPCLLMRDARLWGNGSEALFNLTNWCKNNADKRMMEWEGNRKEMTLSSRLLISKELQKVVGVECN